MIRKKELQQKLEQEKEKYVALFEKEAEVR